MKTAAVLLDGGFVRKKLAGLLGNREPTAAEVVQFAKATLASDEELFRIYYYDCMPSTEQVTNPISARSIDLGASVTCRRGTSLLEQLSAMEHVAFRAGHLMFTGWGISKPTTNALVRNPRSLRATDLRPQLKQKRVDMKIGLDIAWLSSKGIVNRIILATADTDFVPAMKFARREGVQVVVATTDNRIRRELREHADYVRLIQFPPAPQSATP